MVNVEEEVNNGEEKAEAVIIGGMVLDVHAIPSIHPKPKTTTPGKVSHAVGGVARNVAECVSKLGTKPYMISALGLDMAGNMLLEFWKNNGLSLEGIRRCKEIETAVVSNMFDSEGELASAVANVESIERFLTPNWIEQFHSNIQSAPILMVDANLSPPALDASCQLAEKFGTPVWFEPVSVSKSRRVASVVKHITFASPNEDELIAMANALSKKDAFVSIKKFNKTIESVFRLLRPAIWVLLEKGIKVVLVTLGSDGILLCSRGGLGIRSFCIKRNNREHGFSKKLYESINSLCPPDKFFCASRTEEFVVPFPALSASVVRLTGAGDCLVGGMLASLCAGLDVMQSAAVGVAAAKVSVEVETNVPSTFSLPKLADDAKSVYFGAKVVYCQSML